MCERKHSLWDTQSGYALTHHHRNKNPMKDTNLYIRLKVEEVYSLPIASIQS